MYDEVREKLLSYGFDKELLTDHKTIEHFAKLIYDEITLNINWDHIPESLHEVYVDMVCGEYLYYLYMQGKLIELPKDLQIGNIGSITAGDMTLGTTGLETEQSRMLAFIDSLRNPRSKRYLFDIVRKALW